MAASLAENFDEFFEIKLADTQDLKNESYKIRHTVYAQELGWEPISPNGMEIDECDPYAFSILLVHKRTGKFAGTARLVIPPSSKPDSKLPFELHCAESLNRDIVDPDTIKRGSFSEISRLSVPNQFRRRVSENNQPFVLNESLGGDIFSEQERRNFPNIAIGLYLGVIAMVNMCNHSHMFVVVEPRLNKRLRLARAEEDARIMDRPGTPQDLAPIVAFLLSDMTTWIRGTNIPADGGMSSNILCEMHGLSS